MFSSNIVKGMRVKHTWSLTFYGGRFLNFRIYLWTWNSLELVECGIKILWTKQTFFFCTMPFNPWAILATWLHVGAP
jgi:hypothetical protein